MIFFFNLVKKKRWNHVDMRSILKINHVLLLQNNYALT